MKIHQVSYSRYNLEQICINCKTVIVEAYDNLPSSLSVRFKPMSFVIEYDDGSFGALGSTCLYKKSKV